jgi:radical SAM protein with 4Fe4S-binding SPASM domain
MGIESDGSVKGCPSLQTTTYVGGTLKRQSLRSIWDESPPLAFIRRRSVDDLWGFCHTCPFAEPCMGGCTFTAHAILGRPGNNPYCHFRARSLAREGKRERLVWADAAPGQPFDNGRFDLVVEPLDAPDDRPSLPRDLVRLRRKPTMRSS